MQDTALHLDDFKYKNTFAFMQNTKHTGTRFESENLLDVNFNGLNASGT